MGKLIVPERYATLGYPKEIKHGLNGDHFGIAKYQSKNDPNYIIVSTELHELITDLRKEKQMSQTATEAL
jgi:hypothetical protein